MAGQYLSDFTVKCIVVSYKTLIISLIVVFLPGNVNCLILLAADIKE
jgi:hypothetical protein